MLKHCVLVVLLCLNVLISAPVYGEAKLNVKLGYQGQGVEGAWIPIDVLVSLDEGDPPFKGRLEVQDDRKKRPSIYSSPVDLVAGSKQQIRLLVPSRLASSRPIRLVSEDGQLFTSETLPTLTLLNSVRDPLVLVVSGSVGGLVALRSLNTSGKHGPKLADLRLEELPDQSWALDSIATIVLRDLTEIPTPKQMSALRHYVECGGVLYIIGGGRPFWKAKEYKDLLPDQLSQDTIAVDQKASAVFKLGKGHLPPIHRFLKTRSGVRYVPPGSETPLQAIRFLGSGAVVMSAFDPDAEGYRTLSQLPRFLKDVYASAHYQLGPSAPHRNALGTLMRNQSEQLFWEYPIQSPTVLLLALCFTGIYVVLLAKGVPLIQRKKNNWPLLVIVPPLAIIFALILMAWAQLVRPETALRTFSYEIVAGPKVDGQRRGRRVIDLGFYGGEKTELNLDLDDHYSPSKRTMVGFENLLNPFIGTQFVERPGKKNALGPVALNPSGFTWMRLETTRMRSLPIEATLVRMPEGLRVRVRNTSDKTLRDIAVLFPSTNSTGKIFFVEELIENQEILVRGGDLLPNALSYFVDLGDYWTQSDADRRRRMLLEALTGVQTHLPAALSGTQKLGELAWVAFLK
ncbi:MAG: hypothetical protein P1V97_10805 [Planctomycetota bacterium]|nr:hypothetical protein [Planctomycetota bacterium]